MEIDDIRAFVHVVDEGGFSQAARRLGIAKSIVSRRIARLEEDLDARLLNRSQRSVSATEAGMEFKVRCDRILSELVEARDSVANHRGLIVGRLRLSIALSFGARYIAGILAQWCMENPKLELDAAYSDKTVDILGERFDAAIRIGVLKDSSLVARRIATVKLRLVASPRYLALHGHPSQLADLARHECLIYSGSRERAPWRLTKDGKEHTHLATGRSWSDSGDAVLQATLAGLGITVLPDFLVADGIRHGSLVELLKDYTLPEEGLYVLRPQSAYVPAKVRGLIELLVSHFGETTPWELAA